MSGKMLGKRQRSQGTMLLTPSMASVLSAAKQGRRAAGGQGHAPSAALPAGSAGMGAGGGLHVQREGPGYLAEVDTAAFLKNCGLCNVALGPGKDTYIYKGEVAFCSEECREVVIMDDERDEQICTFVSIKDTTPSAVSGGASGSDQSGSSGGETTVAAA
ncbi:hypothetical protein GUJ93_ZPchr0006g44343 [Zizania palustris]|uniref:FLZ-type domain-containing protein n=1 Tax=Zizania palustris TaxID=103762 RepID=A0A8J5SB08_ZIZPA|nr:hypothetical protein GUJ93_ZPchr0006g44343 [Zizania palustris]